MKTLYLIRHGATASNARYAYLGRSDEPLSERGVEQASARHAAGMPRVEALFASPLTRCLQTAHILYPNIEPTVIPEFIEIDFGRFEGKVHDQLLDDEPGYQAWLDSGGEAPIPDGESMALLRTRVRAGFFKMLGLCGGAQNIAAVVHGGTIMALLAELCDPPRGFHDGYTQNCQIVACDWDGAHLRVCGEAD